MKTDLPALAAMLYTVSQEAGSIARRLRPEEDWQYPSAVAVRIYTDDCARHLAKYLRQQTPSELAWRLRYEAALCTGKLAPLCQLLHRAATLASQLEGAPPPTGSHLGGRLQTTGSPADRPGGHTAGRGPSCCEHCSDTPDRTDLAPK